jgi:RNA polymerase sigma-70 factor (ECF subfamily)
MKPRDRGYPAGHLGESMQPYQPNECAVYANSSSDAALYDRYAHIIFVYVRFHTSSREDAEDMTLEVFTAALEHNNLAGLTAKEQLTWLRRVARNKLVDSYRRNYRHPTLPIDELAETIYEDERHSPEHIALRQETYGQLHKAISSLPALQQQVVQLRFGYGLRFADIAILLNKREAAVRKLISRTLTYLRSIYDQDQQGGHNI